MHQVYSSLLELLLLQQADSRGAERRVFGIDAILAMRDGKRGRRNAVKERIMYSHEITRDWPPKKSLCFSLFDFA